jgi:hypothetical protein
MNRLLVSVFCLLFLGSCSFFGEKNKVSDYIEAPDYSLKSVEYVPVLPVFGRDIVPVSLYFGYDEQLYAVDSARAIVSYDAAGNLTGRFALPRVHFVVQNRSLDLYALGRIDTVINNQNYDLPVMYRISPKKAVEGGVTRLDLNTAVVIKKMVYPFCINEASKLVNRAELQSTGFGAIGFLDNNAYYVTTNGPAEPAGQFFITPRNSILNFSSSDVFQGGYSEGPGFRPGGLSTYIQPPQRARMDNRLGFMYTVLDSSLAISVRLVDVVNTPDGLVTSFRPLGTPSSAEATDYLYRPFRFRRPASVLFAGVNQKYIFVADAGRDSVYVFQENGYEGTQPPPQYSNRKLLRVSFGGRGNGPLQFNRPSSVAFFDRMLYVADAGNRRILRFRLTSDYD